MEDLFNIEEYTSWQKEWQNMPECAQKDLTPYKTLLVHFENYENVQEFAALLNQKITPATVSLWFPQLDKEIFSNKRYVDENK